MAVDTFIIEKEVDEDLKIDVNDLSTGFSTQAAIFVHYGRKQAAAERQSAVKKLLIETTHAQLDRKIREEAAAAGKKTTENGIEQEIATNPIFIKAKMEHIEADSIETANRITVEAFRQRKDMLIQLGADARQEMQGEMRMSAASSTAHIDAYKEKHGHA
jgi:hypothetical protein